MPDDPPIPDRAKNSQDTLDMLRRTSQPQEPMRATVWGRRPHLQRNSTPRWLSYYWRLIKCMGRESYRTWRQEMFAGALIAVVGFFIVWFRGDPFAEENLQIILLATAIGLGLMGLWHLIRAPWVLQKRTFSNQGEDDPWGWGIFGILIIVGIFGGAYYGSVRTYRAKVPALNATFLASPAPNITRTETRNYPKESPNSLRLRTLKLVNELNQFWSQRPQPIRQPIQNPSTDEERKSNAAWDQYWRDVGVDYQNANYKERLLGIVREYKNKGIPTGFMEQGIDQPNRFVGAGSFGGSALDDCFRYMNELCELREFAYHVDAQDQPIFLAAKPQK